MATVKRWLCTNMLSLLFFLWNLDRIPARPSVHRLGPPVQSSHRTTHAVNQPRPRLGTERYHHSGGERRRDAAHSCKKAPSNPFSCFEVYGYIILYYLTSSKLEWNKDFSTKGEGVLYNCCHACDCCLRSLLAFSPDNLLPFFFLLPNYMFLQIQHNICFIYYWYNYCPCNPVALLQPVIPALISHLKCPLQAQMSV